MPVYSYTAPVLKEASVSVYKSPHNVMAPSQSLMDCPKDTFAFPRNNTPMNTNTNRLDN